MNWSIERVRHDDDALLSINYRYDLGRMVEEQSTN